MTDVVLEIPGRPNCHTLKTKKVGNYDALQLEGRPTSCQSFRALQHINAKARQRANSILRCFVSGNTESSVLSMWFDESR